MPAFFSLKNNQQYRLQENNYLDIKIALLMNESKTKIKCYLKLTSRGLKRYFLSHIFSKVFFL